MTLGDDGIWRAEGTSQIISYPDDGHADCLQIEDQSFWFHHRNACISAAIDRYGGSQKGPIVDVGGGNGFVSLRLQQSGFDTILVEPGETGAKNAYDRGIRNVVCATFQDAQFDQGSVGGIGLFDVVEHIEQDREFLESLAYCLAPRGRIYVTVPAFNFLRSYSDDDAGHYRRYSKQSLASAFEDAGYNIDYITYFFSVLPLPIFLFRTLPYRLGVLKKDSHDQSTRRIQSHHGSKKSISNKIANAVFKREVVVICEGKRMSFGGSILAVASPARS